MNSIKISFSVVLLLFLTALAAADDANDVKSAFEKHQVVPDVIPKAPNQFLKITYKESGVAADKGNVLTPTQVQKQPQIEWKPELDSYYTLILTDPDAPSRTEPKAREFKHWVVGNIPGDDIDSGDVLTEYIGSGPPKDTGLHRYVFLLYKQPGKLEFNEPIISNKSRKDRPNFKVAQFAEKYNLGEPVAGNFYQAEFDDYVPILHKQLAES